MKKLSFVLLASALLLSVQAFAADTICGTFDYICGGPENRPLCEYYITDAQGARFVVNETAKRLVSSKQEGDNVCLDAKDLSPEGAE